MRHETNFVHLRVASRYSPRYGTASPAALAARAAGFGMPALALTDRDGLYGAYKHALACAAVGIAPVLGVSLPCAAGAAARVTVLAIGRAGFAALCRLVSATTGQPAALVTPPMLTADMAVLLGPDSDAGQAIARRRYQEAERALRRWKASAATVAVEITDQLRPGDTARARRMLALALATDTTAVISNAVRYLDPADSVLAQVIDAVRHDVPLGTAGLPPHNGRAHLASPAEMARAARRVGGDRAAGLLAATAELGRRCALDPKADLGIGIRHLPETTGDLRRVCEHALTHGYRGDKKRARDRMEHELAIIDRTGLAPYFLTVAEVTARIKNQGIRCAIRGSGAGSLVNHLLGISAIDPLDYGLLMERFLSHTRETMPDIDLDVESARRIEAYRVILGGYGEARTATVCMLQTYRARSAIRDVAAVFGLPRTEIDALAKAFPHIRAAHIEAALTELPELRASNLDISQLTTLFRLAARLDGLPRHPAMHPCGVLLSDGSLKDRTPVTRTAVDDLPLSQLDKDDAETAGVIKLDVLGVRMQSAMACALSHIENPPDLDALPRDDEATFELIRSTRTIGCFQVESPGQRDLLTRTRPRGFADLITQISLFRPGPVNSDMISPYVRVRHGESPASYPDQSLRDSLAETGGVVIYHEQVMRVIDVMTGCGLAEADRVRRRLPDGEDWFRRAAAARGYPAEVTGRVWQVLAAFGAFGFCKAHAAAFAVPVYQSAWLKAHHPAAFYAGVLTHDPGMYPKRVILQDARLAGVPVLGPDINASRSTWIITSAGSRPALRASLHEINGISGAELASIAAGQPFASLRDFWQRARVSRPVTERLIRVGAFDSLYPEGVTRRDLLARLGMLDRFARPDRTGALPLDFGGEDLAGLVPAGQLRDLDPAERVAAELEILGFEVSTHVIGCYGELLDGLGVVSSARLAGQPPGSVVLAAGVKVAVQTPAVRSGQRVVFASLDDAAGVIDLAFFGPAQERCAARLFGSWLLLVSGRVRSATRGVVTLTALDCWDLAGLEAKRRADGIAAVRAAIAAVPARPARGSRPAAMAMVYPNGFVLSPYAETGGPGGPPQAAPRKWSI